MQNKLQDTDTNYNIKILELQSGNETIKNIGPLLYISRVSGLKMDSIVNYLILILCFLVDPLALALVLTSGRIFELNDEEKEFIKFIQRKPIIQSDDVNRLFILYNEVYNAKNKRCNCPELIGKMIQRLNDMI